MNSQKVTRNIFCLAAVLLLAGCSEHESLQQDTGKRVRIDIRGEVQQEYVTRANDGGFADGDNIGVFIVNRDGGNAVALKVEGNHADNVKFTYDAALDLWTGSYDLYWKDLSTSVDAYSYYPFNSSLSSVEAFPVTIREKQQGEADGEAFSGYEASDFLWAKAENVAPGNTINLKHQHVMAGVQVMLEQGSGFTADSWGSLQKVVLIENTRVNTQVNLSTGAVSLSDETVKTIIPQQNGPVWRAVVAPQTIAANTLLLNITVDGTCYEFKRSSQTTLLPGKLHKFTIRVDKREPAGDYEFSLISETITPWENDKESHNGTSREYITVQMNDGDYIGEVIEQMGIDPSQIINLKLIGVFGIGRTKNEWGDPIYNAGSNFDFIRNNMPQLEAINMKELRIGEVTSFHWEGGWGDPPYNLTSSASEYIPMRAFANMESLAYVVWPDSLKGIGNGAFVDTGLRGSLILPEGLKHIGEEVFQSPLLTGELYIPSTVEYIGNYAFYGCNFSNELLLPDRMIYLGNASFSGCPFMTGIVHAPDGIIELNRSWPDQIGGQVVVPQGVKKINGFPRGAVSAVIPEGVEIIGEAAFSGTKKLHSLRIPSTVRKIGRAAFESAGITHVNLPEGIDIIEESTFNNCENLMDTVTIPSTVELIKRNAFRGCKQLAAVVLPKGLVEINEEAFVDCYSLDYIRCLGTEPPAIHDNTFSGVEKDNFTVVVPESAVETYRNADGWKEFKRISGYRNFVCRPMSAKLLNKSNVRDIVLNADEAWTVKSCPDWITLDKTSGNKKTELKATIAALPHSSTDREGTVVFQLNRNDENGDPITCSYKVKQYNYEYDEDAVLQLQKATKGKNGGIDILFVGDGYDAEDIAKGTYRQHIEQEMEYFFAVEPYKTYRDYFNVSMAMSLSFESGVVDSPDKWRNTKFNITYGAGKDGRLAVPFDEISSYVLQDGVTNSPITPDNNHRSLVICVLNSDAYEGLTSCYGNGFAIAVCPHSTLDYPNDARGLIQHEAGGHGWGRLDDEYIYHQAYIQKCSCSCCNHVDGIVVNHAMNFGWNVSLEGKYQNVEWKHLIFDSRYDDIVDLYEGGHMHARGIYRSELNSCMNNNVPYFSTWSRQLIVKRTLEAAGEIFDFETFVSKDKREYGDKFLSRSHLNVPWQQVKAMYSEHHGTVLKKGSPMDYIKKGDKR